MRIAIVNDLAIAVTALRKVVQTVPDYQVVWTAKDGSEAVTRCAQDTPDLILMDLQMPVMDGVEATRQIMHSSPCGILVVTSCTEKRMSQVYAALCQGALDAVDTPVMGTLDSDRLAKALLHKIAMLQKLIKPVRWTKTTISAASPKSSPKSSLKSPNQSLDHTASSLNTASKPSSYATSRVLAKASSGISSGTSSGTFPGTSSALLLDRSSLWSTAPPLIAIGSSTGGPKALAAVLAKLPPGCKSAIAVVQHLDAQFSAGLVAWLSQQINLPVRIAQAGEPLAPGTVLIAGTNDHLHVKPDLTLDYTSAPIDYPYRPSVDVFFKSLAEHWTRRGTAVLLTGMGRDGAQGLAALRDRGWHTIAQDQASCVVYGMPKAAAELNAAVEVLPPEAIATALLQTLKPKR
jgi:two-component system, chemotaxis family, response regulator WspF